MEMSQAAGITLVKREERNPLYTTTYGVGEMIRHAIQKGCRRFLIGIGGSATNDGGIGMLQALGYDFLTSKRNPVAPGATGLKELSFISDTHVLPELKECEFHIACDVTNPLCGETGCRHCSKTISESRCISFRNRSCRRAWFCISCIYKCSSRIRHSYHIESSPYGRSYEPGNCPPKYSRYRRAGFSADKNFKIAFVLSQNINVFPIQGFIHAADCTEFPAHRTGIVMLRRAVIADCLRRFRIQSTCPLTFPVKSPAGISHFIINISRTTDTLRNIGCMSCNFTCNNPLLYVLKVWQCQVLCGRYIAQEGSAIHSFD